MCVCVSECVCAVSQHSPSALTSLMHQTIFCFVLEFFFPEGGRVPVADVTVGFFIRSMLKHAALKKPAVLTFKGQLIACKLLLLLPPWLFFTAVVSEARCFCSTFHNHGSNCLRKHFGRESCLHFHFHNFPIRLVTSQCEIRLFYLRFPRLSHWKWV